MTRLLSIREVAQITGMSIGWWRRMVSDGEITVYRMGTRVLIAPVDIDAMLQKCRVDARKDSK